MDSHGSYPGTEVDGGDLGASVECIISDGTDIAEVQCTVGTGTDDTVGSNGAGTVAALIEHMGTYGVDSTSEGHGDVRGVMHHAVPRSLSVPVSVVHAGSAACGEVVCLQRGASVEHTLTVINRYGQGNGRQCGAVFERRTGVTGQPVGNDDTLEQCAIAECLIADGLDCAGEHEVGHCASREDVISDGGELVTEGYVAGSGAVEGIVPHSGDGVRKHNRSGDLQVAVRSDGCDSAGDGQVGDGAVIPEHFLSGRLVSVIPAIARSNEN